MLLATAMYPDHIRPRPSAHMTQLQFPVVPSAPVAFRPIHYLGSKLRLISAIQNALDVLAPTGALCDLFAGSGTISVAMAQARPVISVDIQEYSRVLCSAMLSPPADPETLGSQVADNARRSELLARLNRALVPILEHEERCTTRALAGNVNDLCEFLEHGSLTWFTRTEAAGASSDLRRRLRQTADRLKAEKLNRDAGSIVTRHFGGAYYSYRQAAELDSLLDVAQTLSPTLRDAGLAPVLSAASEVVNTVGKHFAQPIRPRDRDGQPKRHLARRIINDRTADVFAVHRQLVSRYAGLPRSDWPHSAVRADFETFLREDHPGIAVVYADPPYTRDHYSRFYHALETMCLRDEPEMSDSMIRTGGKPRVSRGFYRTDRHQSPFCIKSLAPSAFENLFDGVRRLNVPLLLSYSPFDARAGARPRLMSVDQIVDLARTRFSRVEVESPGPFAHSKLNIHELNTAVSWDGEVLITCCP